MAASRRRSDEIRRVAAQRLGLSELRPGLEEAIRSVIDGRDTLAVMPTGWGKSAIYQVAAVIRAGLTIVVSPMLALQRDQVDSIEDQELPAAVEINSMQSMRERDRAFRSLAAGRLEFLFLAPEQFDNDEVMSALWTADPSLFVVDEAHCVSQWGHDFRPEYLRLDGVIAALGHPPTLALTATAAPPVRREIVLRLGMRDPAIHVRGFDRPNIWLGVERFEDADAKHRALGERVNDAEKPEIVYVATRREAEDVATTLREGGVSAAHYHAGLPPRERRLVQDRFMDDDEGVIVATIAFGMGVDKPDVRFVFHHEISGSVDAFYQELGRAGRDGAPATSLLFYRPQDLGLHRFFTGGKGIGEADLLQVADAVGRRGGELDALEATTGLTRGRLDAAVNLLARAGGVRTLPGGIVRAADGLTPTDAIPYALALQERHRAYERSRIEMMRGYAEVRDCRRRFLLSYFGEDVDDACGNCDRCEEGIVAEGPAREPFEPGTRVRHRRWGEGEVQRYGDGTVVILFDHVGYRTLSLDLVLDKRLLARA